MGRSQNEGCACTIILHWEACENITTLDVPAKATSLPGLTVGNGALHRTTFNLTGALLPVAC